MTTTYENGTGPRAQQAQRDQAERERLAGDLAHWAGIEARECHEEDVAAEPEDRHYTRCCEHAYESAAHDTYADAMELPLDKLRERHAFERPLATAGYAQRLLVRVCDAAGDVARDRARAEGRIPADVRRAGWDAEAYERYLHRQGRDPEQALIDTMRARLLHLYEIEQTPGWEQRAEDRARREGVLR